MDRSDKQKYLFGSLFHLANKLQVLGDQYLAEDDMTIRQWFLTVTIMQFGENPPTLNEVAERMGSSRQNVKQLVSKLAEKGFLTVERDCSDARVIRLRLTAKSQSFWQRREAQDGQFIAELFSGFTNDELNIMYNGFKTLEEKIQKLGGERCN